MKNIFKQVSLVGTILLCTLVFAPVASADTMGAAGDVYGSMTFNPATDSRALLVGTLSLAAFVGIAGAVLWHTARRHRRTN